MSIIAVDPGTKGGIAWEIMGIVHAVAMPETDAEFSKLVHGIITEAREADDEPYAIIEQVRGHIGHDQPGHTMFIFGESFGFIRGFFVGSKVQGYLREPQKWQRPFNLGTKGASKDPRERGRLKTIWKNKLKDEAQRRFPNMKVTLSMADALLILEYARHHRSVDSAYDF